MSLAELLDYPAGSFDDTPWKTKYFLRYQKRDGKLFKNTTTKVQRVALKSCCKFFDVSKGLLNLFNYFIRMVLVQVSQISFESKVCGVKRRHFYSTIVNR